MYKTLISALVFGAGSLLGFYNQYHPESPPPQVQGLYETADHNLSSDELALTKFGINQAQSLTNHPKEIISALAPHHLLASHLIAQLYQTIDPLQVDQIILVSPDHQNLGPLVSTSFQSWATPYGQVDGDQTIIQTLIESGLVENQSEALTSEHGLYGHMSFIKYYFPQASVIPLAVSNQVSLTELDFVKTYLDQTCSECLLMASVDFSHHLSPDQAIINDQETLSFIEAREYQQLLNLSDAFVDSPQSLILADMWAQRGELTPVQVQNHTNSAELLGDPSADTTSYFTLYWSR